MRFNKIRKQIFQALISKEASDTDTAVWHVESAGQREFWWSRRTAAVVSQPAVTWTLPQTQSTPAAELPTADLCNYNDHKNSTENSDKDKS